jgi:polysaccharide deacetylase 2 family uncharacterized protein YibQ
LRILGRNIPNPFAASDKNVPKPARRARKAAPPVAREFTVGDGFVDNADWLQAEAERLQYNQKHFRFFVGISAVLWIIILSGLGAIAGWLYINGVQTTADREQRQPRIMVPIFEASDRSGANDSDIVIMLEPSSGALKPSEDVSISMTAQTGRQTQNNGQGLAPVDDELLELTGQGQLPMIAGDGRMPWKYYAAPYENDRRPKISIVISQLGLSDADTQAVIGSLPAAISLSFSAFSRDLQEKIDRAKRDGHEVLLDLPMEPLNYPYNDPGPNTLLTTSSVVENLENLEWTMAKGMGYIGLVTHMGGRFTTDSESLLPILEAIRGRGLMLIDSRATSRSLVTELATSIDLPRVYNNSFIDRDPKRLAIEKALKNLEERARTERNIVAFATPLPVTLDVLKEWISGLDGRGITLAPVSSIANLQRIL